ALSQIDGELLRRYPDPTAAEFRALAGTLFELPTDCFSVGNGSDHLLSLIMRAFVEAADRVAYPWPTYVLYKTLADLEAAIATPINFNESFDLPVDELIQTQAKVTFIASPASPSGTQIPLQTLETLACALSGLLVIDEAYVDFVQESALDLVRRYENVVILRTLSKGYSLAGLRLGFAIAQPPVIHAINQVKDSYSVDAIACRLGTVALEDQAHKNQNAERVRQSRDRLRQQLETLGFRIWPSVTNFLWTHPPSNAQNLTAALKQENIYIRHFNLPGLNDKVRISVGTDEQNARLIQALGKLV
ncbi:MAG: histidinol-phosphate transaminase, partial [Cyanobacteria bacterium P01_F01_bin.42]